MASTDTIYKQINLLNSKKMARMVEFPQMSKISRQ